MSRLASQAKTILPIISAYVGTKIREGTNSIAQSHSVISTYVRRQQFQQAFNSLTLTCSLYEQNVAFAYLSGCVSDVSNNLNEILASQACPQKYLSSVATICYSSKCLNNDFIIRFCRDILSKVWGSAAVEALAHSNAIPDGIKYLNPRNKYTLEEIHGFSRRFEEEYKKDYTWFYENFPISKDALPESEVQVKIRGKEMLAAQQVDIEVAEAPKQRAEPEKPLRESFSHEDYLQIEPYLKKLLQNWFK